ncbi:MAG: hypothetical protein ACJ72H_30880 [Candidatus Sulfotelmatobacter sp.]
MYRSFSTRFFVLQTLKFIEARLPKRPPPFLAEQFALVQIAWSSFGQQRVRGTLFKELHDRRRSARSSGPVIRR